MKEFVRQEGVCKAEIQLGYTDRAAGNEHEEDQDSKYDISIRMFLLPYLTWSQRGSKVKDWSFELKLT